MENVRAILFDMDGTLYQDFGFHRPYIRYMLEGTVYEDVIPDIIALAERILQGRSIPMNRFYRLRGGGPPDSVWQLEKRLGDGLTGDLPFTDCYEIGLEGRHFLGDAWEVVTYLADAMGILEEKGESAFCRVREEMCAGAIVRNQSLLDLLSRLKERYETVLLSNSPCRSASDFIDKLGLADAFSAKIYGAEKPYGLFRRLFEERPELRGKEQEIVSVGDHAFNEIVNVELAGGRTVWVNPYGEAPWIPCTCEVKNLDDLMELLEMEFLAEPVVSRKDYR